MSPVEVELDEEDEELEIDDKVAYSAEQLTDCNSKPINTSSPTSSLMQNYHRHQQQNSLLTSSLINNHHHKHHHHHHHHQNHNHNNNHHHHHHHNHHHHQQHQIQLHNFNSSNKNHQYNNSNNNNNNHHQQQQQQQQRHTMAHYKFHNDCQSSVLTYEQVKRLDFVMDQTVPIHGRGNFPTLYVKLKELIRLVRYKLQKEHSIDIRDVRLNGGAASYVLAPENSHYNDLDLIFGTDLSDEDKFDVIRDVVLECLKEFYPRGQEEEHEIGVVPKQSESVVIDKGTTLNGGSSEHYKDTSMKSEFVGQTNKLNTYVNSSHVDKNVVGDGSEGKKVSHGDKGSWSSSKVEKSDNQVDLNDKENLRTGTNSELCTNIKKLEPHPNNEHAHVMQNYQYQHQSYQMPLSSCAIKEAYVHKMVKVNDDDRWSLISLGFQQSEANCCGQVNNCQSSTVQLNHNQSFEARQQQHHQFATNDNEPQGFICQSSAQLISSENPIAQHNQQQHQTPNHNQHQDQRNHYQQQQQFPNSIELKFVDRMRRKFEFSVDSFQIILDSLIQFYDYAPQSTIASQRILINSHPSSTMINTRPLIDKRKCTGSCAQRALSSNCKTNPILGSSDGSKSSQSRENCSHHNQQQQQNPQNQQTIDGICGTRTCESLLNNSQGYYQLPIESANSPSISSVASSSGCSSSSSVVSSSSSSLSCDEDHEDLYCYVESPSSSASTSSLLSSTNMSMLFSDGLCSVSDLPTHHQKSNQAEDFQAKSSIERKQLGSNYHNSKSNSDQDISNKSKLSSTVAPTLSENAQDSINRCVEAFRQQKMLAHCDYDIEKNTRTSCAVISENFYPTVIGRSEYGNFKEALYHLEKKLIATRSPEEIRGGGLLKYCNLLVKNYKPTNVYQIRTLERYMCSRFFIDFSDLNQQQAKLESYLANHFSDDPILKFDYLTVLHNVVQRSTVCLMNHELRLTLNMIRDLAYKLNEQQEQQQQQQQLHQSHLQNQQLSKQQQVQQHPIQAHAQQPQQHYYQQKPVLIQSGVYRVKLVNYTLAKPATGSCQPMV